MLLALTVAACSLDESKEPHETSPAMSPDGRQVAFSSKDAIYVAVPGGTARRITDPGKDESDGSPEWSPDGSRLVFTRTDESVFDPWGTLHVVNADGGGLRRLTVGRAPSWSPAGKRIAYELFGLESRVYTIEADGTHKRLVLHDAGEPAWSPDGSRLVVVRGLGEAMAVYDLKTKRTREVVRSNGQIFDAAWSPDGTRIVFSDTRGRHQLEIYVVNVDGTGLRRLTRNAVDDLSPAWTRDGQIVFSRLPDDGPARLFVMNRDGSGVRRHLPER